MGVRVTEQAVDGSAGGVVKVRRDNGRVTVTWFCGDYRSFTPDDVKAAIEYVDRMRPHGDVWLSHKDSDGRAFAAVVTDGELRADNSALSALPSRSVPWDDLKKALRKAA